MNELQQFFAQGAEDVLGALGERCTFSRRGEEYASPRCALVDSGAQYALEVGGGEITLTGVLTVRKKDLPFPPRAEDLVVSSTGRKYYVTDCTSSSFDANYTIKLRR